MAGQTRTGRLAGTGSGPRRRVLFNYSTYTPGSDDTGRKSGMEARVAVAVSSPNVWRSVILLPAPPLQQPRRLVGAFCTCCAPRAAQGSGR